MKTKQNVMISQFFPLPLKIECYAQFFPLPAIFPVCRESIHILVNSVDISESMSLNLLLKIALDSPNVKLHTLPYSISNSNFYSIIGNICLRTLNYNVHLPHWNILWHWSRVRISCNYLWHMYPIPGNTITPS